MNFIIYQITYNSSISTLMERVLNYNSKINQFVNNCDEAARIHCFLLQKVTAFVRQYCSKATGGTTLIVFKLSTQIFLSLFYLIFLIRRWVPIFGFRQSTIYMQQDKLNFKHSKHRRHLVRAKESFVSLL